MKHFQAFSKTAVRRISLDDGHEEFHDTLAVEEPLEIRIGFRENEKLVHRPISITMRTPGDDAALAAGFLFTEGIIKERSNIADIRQCGFTRNALGTVETARPANTVIVEMSEGVSVDLKRLERNFYTTSSCGVCGKSSIDALHAGAQKLPPDGFRLSRELVHEMPDLLQKAQGVFRRTGGLHAAGLFDAEGNLDIVFEDVGRHNAVDKVIGQRFLDSKTPLSCRALIVSGRASFELVQKALMAGIPVLAAVGAPSSLAVELAAEFGLTLAGFVRNGSFNIYCGGERIEMPRISTSLRVA